MSRIYKDDRLLCIYSSLRYSVVRDKLYNIKWIGKSMLAVVGDDGPRIIRMSQLKDWFIVI